MRQAQRVEQRSVVHECGLAREAEHIPRGRRHGSKMSEWPGAAYRNKHLILTNRWGFAVTQAAGKCLCLLSSGPT